jgi:hypothetical protein
MTVQLLTIIDHGNVAWAYIVKWNQMIFMGQACQNRTDLIGLIHLN